jgi:hypothetical protein
VTRQNSSHEPPEVAALLNPALIALLLARAAKGYLNEANVGLPFVYAPIITTISLYPDARETLSMNVTTQFAAWVDRIAQLQISLQSKIVDMVPIVNEGILFALLHDVLKVEGGALVPGGIGPTGAVRGDTEDMEQAQKSAVYLGRWLVRAGSPSTICAMLGVTP